MKKFLAIMLSGVTALSLLACANNNPEPEPEKEGELPQVWSLRAIDTMIQDSEDVHKCFWEDGELIWNNFSGTDRQVQKSAILTTQTEYDVWFRLGGIEVLLLSNEEYYWPVEFECDESKIEIKYNPDKENHFILKILQPCDNEKLTFLIANHSNQHDLRGDTSRPDSATAHVTITVSATE